MTDTATSVPHFMRVEDAAAALGIGRTHAWALVKRGDLEIGRFEVTRVQFSEFDKAYKYDAGTENYPANGVTLEGTLFGPAILR